MSLKFARLSQRMIESAKNRHFRIALAFFKVLSKAHPFHENRLSFVLKMTPFLYEWLCSTPSSVEGS